MEDPRGDTKRRKLFHGDVWKIEVSETKQTWNVHQDLLCKTSTFFRSAVKKEWNDGETKIISLPEDDVDIFDIYVQWLYQDKLLIEDLDENLRRPGIYVKLVKCYCFGEKIQDAVFQNNVIDGIFAQMYEADKDGTTWNPTCTDAVYAGTSEGSPLRTLILNVFAYRGNERWMKAQRNTDFLFDLSKKLLEVRARPSDLSPISRNASQNYHKPVQARVVQQGKPETNGSGGA